ncbi:hypothetical protein [Pectobacterium phage PcaP1EGY]
MTTFQLVVSASTLLAAQWFIVKFFTNETKRKVRELEQVIKGKDVAITLAEKVHLDHRVIIRTLRSDMDTYKKLSEGHRETIRSQQSQIADLLLKDERATHHERIQVISHIKFHCHIPFKGLRETNFKLGLGPCGKVVTRLEFFNNFDKGRSVVTQYHSDGTKKEFTYLQTDIVGRVEIAHNYAYLVGVKH